MAARRYTGTWSESRYCAQEVILVGAIAHAGLRSTGPLVLTRYYSPYRLWSLRSYEVLIEEKIGPQ